TGSFESFGSRALAAKLINNDIVPARTAGIRNMMTAAAAEVTRDRFTSWLDLRSAALPRKFSIITTDETSLQKTSATNQVIGPRSPANTAANINCPFVHP